MLTLRFRRHVLIGLAALVITGIPHPGLGQAAGPCFDDTEPTPEGFGPTDISAVSGNGGLSAAFNPDGTVTVLKWPSPSFYDQIKFRTFDRGEPLFGALPNEGALIGVAWRATRGGWKFAWLRDWHSRQSFADDDTDEVVTVHRNRRVGLKITVRDLVAVGADVLYRNVSVKRSKASRVRRARVISFANFNPVFSKSPQSPTDDWCSEEDNDDGAAYAEVPDAIIHERSGADASTGNASSAALVMGFDGSSDGHHVGVDIYAGGDPTQGQSAYDDAEDGTLSGGDVAAGQADAALADQLNLRSRRRASTTVVIAAAFSRNEALTVLRDARSETFAAVQRRKTRWWKAWLRRASLPRGAPRPVTHVAKRSLISIRQAVDPARSMIVASIATQPPYGLDWIRDGAYINAALHRAGHAEVVSAHNERYGELQATRAEPPEGQPATPPGNWAQNYYADGVAGGPIPYEIDETGYGIWTLWEHYRQTQDRNYLLQAEVYEAIQRAAHYLRDPPPVGCTDPTTGLQCVANEEGNETPTQTLIGAQAVWLGLDSAVRAARVRGGEIATENANQWSDRRNELAAAIDQQFFDEECSCYTRDYETGGAFLWPVGLLPYGSERSEAQADVNWRHMARVLRGTIERGRYESRMLLGNAYEWAGSREIRKVRRGLRWIAAVASTDRTGLLGEAWMVFPEEQGRVTTMQAQPHATTHAMFYLAALKAYGAARYSFD